MLLTPKQVSEHLQVSVAQVVKLIRCGSIPAAKIGHRYRVDSSDLDEFLSRSKFSNSSNSSRRSCRDAIADHQYVEQVRERFANARCRRRSSRSASSTSTGQRVPSDATA